MKRCSTDSLWVFKEKRRGIRPNCWAKVGGYEGDLVRVAEGQVGVDEYMDVGNGTAYGEHIAEERGIVIDNLLFLRDYMYPEPKVIIPKINFAWVVIDNSLFLWDYIYPDPEFIGFED
ncbi:hypothetical protein G7Z17_g13206 [Cylindrodendrum hubeiense]|uniref:Nucleoporin Nup133/Nup155-like N-terminal domain-containing protein n=1 Tax=Cylindrodendrum hubeiense TaxID=595255 RepID=A0A9P5GU23_9HYPO|nr:hypothetical protein G7Z17_g13206 [Cylindrodendrum hubeiense]